MSKKKSKKSPQLLPAKQAIKTAPAVADEKSKKFKKWHKILIAIFLLLFVPAGAIFAFEQAFAKKVYPGVIIGELRLGGQAREEAVAALNQATRQFSEEGIIFFYQNKKTSLAPIVTAASDPDLSRTIFTLETEKTAEEAFSFGRGGDFLDNLKDQLKFLLFGQKINLQYQVDTVETKKILKENFGSLETPAKNAEIKIASLDSSVSVLVTPEEEGRVFDYETAVKTAFEKVAELKNEPTLLNFISEQPEIKKIETSAATERVKKLAELCQITLGEAKKTWTISQNQIRDWLEFQSTATGLGVGFNKNKTEEFLKTLSREINVQPQNAKFKIENGIVKEFQIHQGGKELNLEASHHAINNYILNLDVSKINPACSKNQPAEEPNVIQLIVQISEPQIPIGSVNNLGIKELVGRGVSNFAGSPVNRRHNIKVGAAKLNGVLIAPGEEFSLNKALGEISGRTGYLTELVIKGNKTIPEFGGGLCQIATTMFRVALDAGLPITERKAHSYRVVYYEPAGIDATIYSPSPDFKFINDTPAYLLLQTKIDGDELIFELWGTSDGRKTEISKPKIFNITSPGPTKIVETEDLPPGVKKCTERAHAGADAEFSRTVTFANGEVKTETWKSHYVPWSAVCLVGKAPAPPPDDSATPPEPTPPPTTNTNSPIF